MKILIGIPLFNEQAYLSECVHSLFNFISTECSTYDISVILVDDGSTDKSKDICLHLSKKFPLKCIRHSDGPRGYGQTILTLFKHAKLAYDILITFDADLQHDPVSIKEILEIMVQEPDIHIVSTSRYLTYRFWKQNTKVPVDRYVTNMLITRTINRCFNLNLTDAFCGLKGYRTEILSSAIDDAGYAFPLVFWHYANKKGLRIKEIETPIIYRLDRRARGEWKNRTKEYFAQLERLVDSAELKVIVQKDYHEAIEKLTEIIDHHSNFPIYIFNDFFKSNWLD